MFMDFVICLSLYLVIKYLKDNWVIERLFVMLGFFWFFLVYVGREIILN